MIDDLSEILDNIEKESPKTYLIHFAGKRGTRFPIASDWNDVFDLVESHKLTDIVPDPTVNIRGLLYDPKKKS